MEICIPGYLDGNKYSRILGWKSVFQDIKIESVFWDISMEICIPGYYDGNLYSGIL